MVFSHWFYLSPLILKAVLAQSPSLPSVTSANLTKERTYEELVTLASAAIDIDTDAVPPNSNGILTFGDHFSITPVLHSQMAEYDILTHNTTYRDFLQVQLTQVSAEVMNASDYQCQPFLLFETFCCIIISTGSYILKSHSVWREYGYAASKAYIAYQDDRYMTIAQQLWDFGRSYSISDEEIESKKSARKSLSLRTECNGKSLLGGVFSNTNSTNGLVDSSPSAAFFTLSALLGELTSNNTYTQYANRTLQFLKNFSYFPHSNGPQNEKSVFALENVNDGFCLSTGFPAWFPDTGTIIEGLSILASSTNDTSIDGLLQDAINSSTVYRDSKQLDGVIQLSGVPLGFPSGDAYLVRGLATAYKRNQVHPTMREYVKEFITVQYNALLDNSTLEQSNIYVDPGTGPLDRIPQRSLSKSNQTYAAMVFVQAINPDNSTSPGGNGKPPSGTGSGASSPGTKNATKSGEIAGGVVGGLAFIGLLSGLTACLCIRRRRRRRGLGKLPSISYLISPFQIPGSSGDTSPISPITRVKRKQWLSTLYSPQGDRTTPGTSPVSLVSRGMRVKSRLCPPPRSPVQEPTVTPSNVQREVGEVDSGVPLNEDPHARFNIMSTAEMARILNARLQAESLQNEMPPAYPESQIG
ncbi:hypothetical protein E1B28_002011 [Marasmius oreades]|uniref:Glycoside hydrolase family 76 protein n=1 Tax=Marasmius oreades TaxID=181124 RepID=A0A9P7V509_9AGAR|nr:uncharacterized protein E1B28_002011 [Marasmius oreades]KAG7100237.1 hypothetical protein E1B28_002011 [Marasmius oreades]